MVLGKLEVSKRRKSLMIKAFPTVRRITNYNQSLGKKIKSYFCISINPKTHLKLWRIIQKIWEWAKPSIVDCNSFQSFLLDIILLFAHICPADFGKESDKKWIDSKLLRGFFQKNPFPDEKVKDFSVKNSRFIYILLLLN